MSQIPLSSGIYQIVNLIDSKMYVGSAVNLRHRWFHHRKRLRNGTHFNAHLQRAWNRAGEKSFSFTVIVQCDRSELLSTEQKFINARGCCNDQVGYNLAPKAGSQLGRKHSEATKALLSAVMKLRVMTPTHRAALSVAWHGSDASKEQNRRAREKASTACIGRIESAETRLKKSIAHLGKPLSESHRAKIAAANRRRATRMNTTPGFDAAVCSSRYKASANSLSWRTQWNKSPGGSPRHCAPSSSLALPRRFRCWA